MVTISKKINLQVIYNIAKMYYLENLTQEEISKKVHISRSQVSRYIKYAREKGIVEVKLKPLYSETQEKLAEELKENLALTEVIVSPLSNLYSPTEEDILNSIAFTGAHYIEQIIPESSIIGVGWGKTLYKTVLALGHNKIKTNVSFIPLIGGLGQTEPYYQVNSIVDRLAEKFCGKAIFLNVPAILRDKETYEEILKDSRVSMVSKLWETCDLALIGCGGPVKNSDVLRSEIDPTIISRLLKMEAVGDILIRFFDKNGNICNTHLESLIVGIPIEKLKRITKVICLSGGFQKVDAIIAAAKAKFFNILITDEWTARNILNSIRRDL